jgi:hypothetical protein
MKSFLNQQLIEKDERVAALTKNLELEKNDQEMATKSEKIMHGI